REVQYWPRDVLTSSKPVGSRSSTRLSLSISDHNRVNRMSEALALRVASSEQPSLRPSSQTANSLARGETDASTRAAPTMAKATLIAVKRGRFGFAPEPSGVFSTP